MVPNETSKAQSSLFVLGAFEPEQACRVLLQDQRPHLVLDVELGEGVEPLVRGQCRKSEPRRTLCLSSELACATNYGGKYFGDQPERSM